MVTLPDKQDGPCFSHVSIFPSLTGQGPATSSLTTSPNSSPPRRTRRSLHPSSQLPASWELFPEKSSQPFRRLKGWNQIQEADLVPLFPSIEGEHSVPQQTHRRPPPDLYPWLRCGTEGMALHAFWSRQLSSTPPSSAHSISALVNPVFCKTQIATQHENARFPCVPD